MSIFDESTLEQAIIDKLVSEGYSYVSGDNLHRELTDVIIEDDLATFLTRKYAANGITNSEIQSIISSLKSASALPVYDANKKMFKKMVEGEIFVREDRNAKDFLLQLIDFDKKDNKNIGYISVSIFGEKTYSQFSNALNKLDNSNIDSLVIDLRGNSGGYKLTKAPKDYE